MSDAPERRGSGATTKDNKPPVVILVRPQLSENIGTAARAMMNCTLTEMRLVAPRHDWLSDRAIAASSGADAILHKAQVFPTTEAAIADLQRIYATTGRNRFMVKPVLTPAPGGRTHPRRSRRGSGRPACYSAPSARGWRTTTWPWPMWW